MGRLEAVASQTQGIRISGAFFVYQRPCQGVILQRHPPNRTAAWRGFRWIRGVVMKRCWVCGNPVAPNTRVMHCSKCQGWIVTPDEDLKREREFRELERMMQSANTYERRGGRLRQTRYAVD